MIKIYSYLMQLRELRELRDVSKMAKEIQRMSKQVNQRFYRLEKAGLSKDSYAYQYSQYLTGKKKPRFTTSLKKLEKQSIQDLFKLGLELNEKLVSRTSSISGVKQIQSNRITRALEEIEDKTGYKINRKDFEEFLNIGGGELLNKFDSTTIIEDFYNSTQSGNVSVKEFVREFKRYKSLDRVDYSKLLRNLKRLSKRKYERAKNKGSK